MTRFVIDAPAVLQLAADGGAVPDAHTLLAPTLLRSQVLSLLHEAVHRGELSDEDGRARLAVVGRMPIRLLGDGVLRRRAWQIATTLGWPSTYEAEYVALTQLQAEALITADEHFARRLEGIVSVASLDTLRRASDG